MLFMAIKRYSPRIAVKQLEIEPACWMQAGFAVCFCSRVNIVQFRVWFWKCGRWTRWKTNNCFSVWFPIFISRLILYQHSFHRIKHLIPIYSFNIIVFSAEFIPSFFHIWICSDNIKFFMNLICAPTATSFSACGLESFKKQFFRIILMVCNLIYIVKIPHAGVGQSPADYGLSFFCEQCFNIIRIQ